MSIAAFMLWSGRVMMWTQRCFLKSFEGVPGDVLILYRIAVLPDFCFGWSNLRGDACYRCRLGLALPLVYIVQLVVWLKKTLSWKRN